MTLSLVMNALVAALLMATIVLGVILARRLAALRASQGELAAMGASFADATAKAEAGLAELRRTAETEGAALQARVGHIEGLKDDLVFLVGRADKAADRLERAIAHAKPGARAQAMGPQTQGGQAQGAQAQGPQAQAAPILRAVASAQPSPAAGEAAQSRPENDGDKIPPAVRELLQTLEGVR